MRTSRFRTCGGPPHTCWTRSSTRWSRPSQRRNSAAWLILKATELSRAKERTWTATVHAHSRTVTPTRLGRTFDWTAARLTRYSRSVGGGIGVAPVIDHTKIFAHHVGGRGFGVSFSCPAIFSDDVVHILYEADAQCAADMIRQPNGPTVRFFPVPGREHARHAVHEPVSDPATPIILAHCRLRLRPSPLLRGRNETSGCALRSVARRTNDAIGNGNER